MKKINKVMSFALALSMMATVAAGTVVTGADYDAPEIIEADSVASGTCGENLTWKIDSAGTLTISGTGAMKDYELSISGSSNGETISHFAPWKDIMDNYGVKKIVIEDGVTHIGNYAFYKGSYTSTNTIFYDITIPKSVTSIGMGAFDSPMFKSIKADAESNSFKSIDGILFSKDEKTIVAYPASKEGETYSIPDTVLTIAGGAFICNQAIKTLTIPESVTKIGENAFAGMWDMKSIKIPKSVASIGEGAFWGGRLISIEVDRENSVYTSEGGVLFSKDMKTLIAYPSYKQDKEYTVPDTVTQICKEALGCMVYEGLETVNLSKNITNLNSFGLFGNCTPSLNEVKYSGTVKEYLDLIKKEDIDPDALDADTLESYITPQVTVNCTDGTLNPKTLIKIHDADIWYYKLKDGSIVRYENIIQDAVNDYTFVEYEAKNSGEVTDGEGNKAYELYYVVVTDDMISGLDPTIVDKHQPITITYKGLTTKNSKAYIETYHQSVKSIEINTVPDKKEYNIGEKLDVTGGKLTVTYDNGETGTIDIKSDMCKGFDSTTAGTKTVTVTYEGKTTTFTVTVKEGEQPVPVNDGKVTATFGGSTKAFDDLTGLAKDKAFKAATGDITITINSDLADAQTFTPPAKASSVKITATESRTVTLKSALSCSGDLTLENITFKTAKGVAAAVTAKKNLTAIACTLGKVTVTGDATFELCELGAVTAKKDITVGLSQLASLNASGKGSTVTISGITVINGALSTAGKLVVTGECTVKGKFTPKGTMSIDGKFNVG